MRSTQQVMSLMIGNAALLVGLGYGAVADEPPVHTKTAAVDAGHYATFMADEALDIQDLAIRAENQRRFFNRITPPGFTWKQPMFPPVMPFDAANFTDMFLDALVGEDTNSVTIFPLTLILDPKTRETLIYNAENKLVAAIPNETVSQIWPEEADPARVAMQIDLLPLEDAEHYLYAKRRIGESAILKSGKGTGDVKKSLGAGEFGFSDMESLSNATMRLTVSNGADVVEIYSYTVLHTSATVVVTWTNEQSNVVTDTNTLWCPVLPPFNGIPSAWENQTTNLLLTNGVGTWEDANVPSNARVRMYAVANRMDSDEDNLSDGAETFLYRTDPSNPDTDGDSLSDGDEIMIHGTNPNSSDTDGDGMSDAWEILNELDPLDNGSIDPGNGAAGDPDGDGFDNALEMDLNAPANNPAWNGEELAYRLTHAHSRIRSITNDLIGLHVDIDQSLDCGGTNDLVQNRTDDLDVPDLLDEGYYIEISVEGVVEDVDTNYDVVSFEAVTNTLYFMGHDGIPDDGTPETCQMVDESATRNNLILANSTVRLRYNTVGHRWHEGAYAEIVGAELIGPLKIETETVATVPADRSRKTLGIGEEVICQILPASTSTTWWVTGGGAVDPPAGSTTTFTASRSPSTPSVHALVGDVECRVDFAVVPPDGEITWLREDAELGVTGTNKVGAESIFFLQVQPTNVSFNYGIFREHIPEQTIIWPNGTASIFPANTSDIWQVWANTGNKTWDTVYSGMASVMKLHNGSGFVDFSWDRLVPEEYLNEENEWVELRFPPETGPFSKRVLWSTTDTWRTRNEGKTVRRRADHWSAEGGRGGHAAA